MSALTKWYPHRPNEDGTYDSICPTCTRTVAREMSEANLVEAETLHKCPGLSPSLAKRIEQPMVPAQILAIAALRTLIDVHQIEETRLRAILADYPAFKVKLQTQFELQRLVIRKKAQAGKLARLEAEN